MAHSSRSTSPDPITLPSSPLGALSSNARPPRRKATKPSGLRNTSVANYSSPSKSFVMETGKPGDTSPWRIRVTVEAEPRDGSSPAKKVTRTTKVPLKGGGSSSPSKKPSPRKSALKDDTEDDAKRLPRKRKGTPIRRRGTRNQPASDDDPVTDADDDMTGLDGSPRKQPLPRRKITPSEPTERTRRLAKARQELDLALQDAMRDDDDRNQHDDDHENEHDDEDDDKDQSEIRGDVLDEDLGDMTIANEDFTMVSIETLQSMKGNTSQLLDNSAFDVGEKSVASVSYLPSSPPVQRGHRVSEVHYPNIEAQASAAKEVAKFSLESMDGAASERLEFSGIGRKSKETSLSKEVEAEDDRDSNASQCQSAAVAGASAEHAIVIEDLATEGAAESEDEIEDVDADADLDIWAEEASRSFEEEQEQTTAAPPHKPQSTQLFSNEPQKPPRPKIPRTWRRSSGIHFNYTDSPEYGALRKPSAASTDVEGAESRSSGVLTPPSTDDEVGSSSREAEEDAAEEGDTSLTQPDAAGTQLQANESPGLAGRQEALSPLSDSSGNGTSPDGEGDTGLFWQTNLPNVYHAPVRPRFQRQKRTIDLSELLDSKPSPQPETRENVGELSAGKTLPLSGRTTRRAKAEIADAGKTATSTVMNQSSEKVLSSPMRKSLLKSSKVGGDIASNVAVNEQPRKYGRSRPARAQREVHSSTLSDSRTGQDSSLASFESQASDQRQLLREMRTASSGEQVSAVYADAHSEPPDAIHDQNDGEISGVQDQSEEDLEESSAHYDDLSVSNTHAEGTTRSYEEHLNLESPQKVRVKFNDSEGNSSLLAPKKDYPPIFGGRSATTPSPRHQPTTSPQSITLVSNSASDAETQRASGIFSRLSTNFWSAVVRPSGPAEILPQPEPVYPHLLRRDIRSRYGVLTEQHPWTMAHMRTLHRLLNSCTSGKSDSIVPKSGPLPSDLAILVDKNLVSVTPDFRWTFTKQHGHVVDAFMQTLVPEHIAQAIEEGEMEFLGDAEARKHRGLLAGRHGNMVVFAGVEGVKEPTGAIERTWVVKALGNCVMANEDSAEKEASLGRR